MKKLFYRIWAVCMLAVAVSGCSDDLSEGNSGGGGKEEILGGYADPKGVMILNQGAPSSQNSSLTFITPEGEVEDNVYRKVNGSAFGNYAEDLWMYNGKFYIVSDGLFEPNGEKTDGELVIVDAVTLKLEKAYQIEDLKFPRPEGSLEEDEMLSLSTPFANIAVLDEKNVFFAEGQGMFRFDTTTGELNLIEGAYNFGNQGGTIEEVASTRGILRVGDCLYCGGGGFWQTTRLFEFAKDKNEVNRVLPDLNGDFISGICQTGEREVMLATCGRGGEKKSYLIFVDLDSWKVVKEVKIAEDISAEFFNDSGITKAGNYIYYAAGGTTIRRLSLETWKAEDCIDVLKDAPEGIHLNCNVTADPSNQYLYVAVSDKYSESEIPTCNYLLIYDCSGVKPVLVNKIVNKTSYPIGIYPMNKFYSK